MFQTQEMVKQKLFILSKIVYIIRKKIVLINLYCKSEHEHALQEVSWMFYENTEISSNYSPNCFNQDFKITH